MPRAKILTGHVIDWSRWIGTSSSLLDQIGENQVPTIFSYIQSNHFRSIIMFRTSADTALTRKMCSLIWSIAFGRNPACTGSRAPGIHELLRKTAWVLPMMHIRMMTIFVVYRNRSPGIIVCGTKKSTRRFMAKSLEGSPRSMSVK